MESQRRMSDERVKSSGPWPAAGGLHRDGTMFLGCLNVRSLRQAEDHCSCLERCCASENDIMSFKIGLFASSFQS